MPGVTRWGTSYFVSRRAAEWYYFKQWASSDIEAYVDRKLADGEIHIGKPPLKDGEKLSIIPGEGRYQIEGH